MEARKIQWTDRRNVIAQMAVLTSDANVLLHSKRSYLTAPRLIIHYRRSLRRFSRLWCAIRTTWF
ncbi:hypothetical protein SERLADRAFT_389544 [Serpula lacrymans var. lacrymans S7.9]|uniref:Uncharacterized protein n=1 Tax=Serpula lacrymans var. lacrymans (strain S7.9) TaxID=578457 RepID=F8NWP9_SERL9|nr:uncharacterized protein SERLADRAFT_389544 [Serpula lacrymans var. lacrymans S7.9]EGO24401.1 hypothetical protein SERLADRAFT_389544 [Serpula lacrymans var. lacrymans S7.9]